MGNGGSKYRKNLPTSFTNVPIYSEFLIQDQTEISKQAGIFMNFINKKTGINKQGGMFVEI